MTQYSKRKFLKMLGLGIAFAPFISLYSSCNSEEASSDKQKSPDKPTDGSKSHPAQTQFDTSKATEADLILLKKDDAQFTEANTYFNKRISKTPKYIAICKTNLGVQTAIALAKQENLPIAIKSGGHSFEGFSNSEGGFVINVTQMKAIQWKNDEVVTIGAGNVLKEVQSALFSKQRLIPTGSCGTVGISGLTLGGGYGFFSRKYGLTCDQVIDFEYIDANSEIKKASDDAELLWALKGGGNGNFGVITSITFKTVPMPAKFAAHVLKFKNLDVERFQTALKNWFAATAGFGKEDFSAFVLNGSTLTILATTYGNYTALSNQIATLKSLADSASFSNTDLPQAMKRYYGSQVPLYFKNASAGYYNSLKDIEEITNEIFETVTSYKGLMFQINTLGGEINNPAFEKTSCYPHRSFPYLSELQTYYNHPNQEDRLLEGFEKIQQLILNAGIKAQYRNYPDINFKNWQEAYYGNNIQKLVKIKRRLDPDNRFRYEQSIPI